MATQELAHAILRIEGIDPFILPLRVQKMDDLPAAVSKSLGEKVDVNFDTLRKTWTSPPELEKKIDQYATHFLVQQKGIVTENCVETTELAVPLAIFHQKDFKRETFSRFLVAAFGTGLTLRSRKVLNVCMVVWQYT